MPNIKRKQQRKEFKQRGFFVHMKMPNNSWDMANYHTHGIKTTRNFFDFQIVLPIDSDKALDIFTNLVDAIDNNKTFNHNDVVWGIIENLPVKLKRAKEDGRSILRVIFPDPHGLFPNEEGCDPLFAAQETIEFF